MSQIKISQLPYVGKSGYTATDIVPFVSYIVPTGTTSETKIDDLKDYVLENSFVNNLIVVGKSGNVNFNTIYDAVNSITGSSVNNRYVIEIGPGFYVEPEISLIGKEYVNLVGAEINSTIVLPDSITNTIFTLGVNNQLSFLTISGATSGIGINCPDSGDFSLIHKVSLFDNDTQIKITSSVVDTQFYGEYVDLNGDYSYGIFMTATNSFSCYVSFENYFNETTGPKPTIANYCEGFGTSLSLQGGAGFGALISGSEYVRAENNADIIASGIDIYGWDTSLRFGNSGGPCTFDIDGVSIVGSQTYDLWVEQPYTSGTIQGSLSHQQINNVSETVYWGFLDHIDGEFDVTRKISVTFKDGTHTDLSTLLFEGGTMGLFEGGVISIVSGLTFSITKGYGYVENIITNSVIKRYDWANTPHTLPPNSDQYVYINNNGILSNTGTRPNSINNIILGRIVTNSTDIIMVDASPLNASHTSNLYSNLFRNALGPIYDTGSIVTENITPYHLDVTSGDYYYSTNEYLPSGGTDLTFIMYYRDGGTGWSTSATTEVINGYDDNSGTISPLPSSAFTKHSLYLVGDGVNEQYFLVLGQANYTTLLDAEQALLPIPPSYFEDSVVQVANIYIRQGQSNIIQIEDIRPVIGFKAGGVNASSTHGNLLGLTADDHTQYLLVDGSRAMEGDISMGGNDIYSANTITTNTISATTYQNLPIDPDTYVTGFTYNTNVFTLKQNNGQSDLTATIDSVTGWTVNGGLTVTGDTSIQSLTATTVSATTLGVYSGSVTMYSSNIPPSPTISTPFIDDYNRVTLSPGGTPSLTYTNTNTGNGNSTIVTNYLNINNGNVAGQSYTTVPLAGFSTPFNPTLSSNNPLSVIEWTFNLRTNRGSIFTGFGAGTYGGAVVLVGSNTNLQSAGSGYALVYGTSGSRNWKLIKYNNGLAGTQTDIIAGGTFANNTSYVSVKIVYTPSTNTWTYYFRDDGIGAWGDPTTTNTLIGSAVDSTYTSTLMSVFGVFFNYSTAASQNLQFDNLRVQQTITPTFSPVDELIVKNYSGSDVFKVKDDGSISTSGSVTSTSGFFGSFSGTYTGNGSQLVLGQSGIMITGTSQLNLTSATTALTLIPGLSTTITVGTQTMVYIQTNGGVNTLATTTIGGTALDVAILVDGAVLAAGGYQRMYADNPTGVGAGNVTNWVANWNTSVLLTLSAGSHTIEVDAAFVQGSSASVSGIANSIKQGTLTIMVLKNN